MFVTASKDHTAKLFDSESLMLLKTYKTERPVNSATISPIFDHVRNLFYHHLYYLPSWNPGNRSKILIQLQLENINQERYYLTK